MLRVMLSALKSNGDVYKRQGKSESAAALKRSLPETSASTSPVSVMTR